MGPQLAIGELLRYRPFRSQDRGGLFLLSGLSQPQVVLRGGKTVIGPV
jgi:hypothetical protein